MGRPLRHDPSGTFHHVVNRGASRRDIFFGDRDRYEFERLLGVAHDRFDVRVHAYCLMTNHFHLLLECPDGHLSDAMHLVSSVYVRHVNERMGRDGPLFRDRFFAKAVVTDAYLKRLVTYIHRNPVAIVGERALATYTWSSLRTYLGARATPRWMRIDLVEGMFGGRGSVAAAAAATRRDMSLVTDARDIGAAVSMVLDDTDVGGPEQGLERTVTMLLLDRLDAEVAAGVRAMQDRPSVDAWRAATSRARRRLVEHPVLADVVDAVLALVA